MKKRIHWPPPGTTEAQAQGCNCPVEDNKHGRGVEHGIEVFYWVNGGCPLHGQDVKNAAKNTTA